MALIDDENIVKTLRSAVFTQFLFLMNVKFWLCEKIILLLPNDIS